MSKGETDQWSRSNSTSCGHYNGQCSRCNYPPVDDLPWDQLDWSLTGCLQPVR